MVNYSPAALDLTFSALSDSTRRGILARLAKGESSVTELAAPYDISLPAVSKHLHVLARAGLIEQEKDGRIRRCRLVAEPMKDAAGWITRYRRFWEEQFDALARYLEEPQKEEKSAWQPQDQARKQPSRSAASSRRRARRSSRRGRSPK
jgi:DNA-binding transcriptional ArsR family regulator